MRVRPSLRRLTAEQLIDSIHKAAAKTWDGQRLFRTSTSTALTRALGRPASRNEISTGRSGRRRRGAIAGDAERRRIASIHLLRAKFSTNWLRSRTAKKSSINFIGRCSTVPPAAQELKLGLAYLKENISGHRRRKTSPRRGETVWCDDDLARRAPSPTATAWKWVERARRTGLQRPKRSHTLNSSADKQQHYFTDASPLQIAARTTIFLPTSILTPPSRPRKS